MKQIKLSELTPYEIIMAMVEGLRNPPIIILMHTYGEVNDKVCFGCAATCTIIRLFELENPEKYLPNEIDVERDGRTGFTVVKYQFYDDIDELNIFECAINSLRLGNIDEYNYFRPKNQFIYNPNDLKLPRLDDDYTEEQLMIYEQLANDNK